MNVGTWGHWQEKGSGRPQSLFAMMEQLVVGDAFTVNDKHNPSSAKPGLSMVICPQANLISQVKRNGKSVQYHGQCDKERGHQLFDYFCRYVKALLAERELRLQSPSFTKPSGPLAAVTAWKELVDLEQAMADTSAWGEYLLQSVTVVTGSFGKRQGLEFSSDMGPFCHTFQV